MTITRAMKVVMLRVSVLRKRANSGSDDNVRRKTAIICAGLSWTVRDAKTWVGGCVEMPSLRLCSVPAHRLGPTLR